MKATKIIISIAIALACTTIFARMIPSRPIIRSPRYRHVPPPPPPRHYHAHHPSRAFWTGVGVGIVGSIAYDALPMPHRSIIPAPPPMAINPVWIPPVYESRPVYDIYGRIVRYEQVLVRAGYWQY